MKFKKIFHKLSPDTRKALAKWGNRILLAGVLVFLVVRLSEVGWGDILRDIPTNPLFYLIFVGMYLGLPLAETFIYKILWNLPFKHSFPELLKKRVYNKDVLNYSGEAHLYMWARKYVDRSDRRLLLDMKDNTIISSLTSMSLALLLLSIFLFTGYLPFDALFENIERTWIIGGIFCLVMLILLAFRFRKSVISVSAKTAGLLFGIHLGRLLVVKCLQILQWAVVMPEVPVSIWFSYLSLQIIVNQIPLLPAKDLVVLGASTGLSRELAISETAVAGMLLVTAVLDKVVNVILFAYLSSRKTSISEPPGENSWNSQNPLIKNQSEPLA